MSNFISSEEFTASNNSFSKLMEIKKNQIDDRINNHNMMKLLIDCAKNETSEELKEHANQILIDEYKYDVSKKNNEKYIFDSSNCYEEVTNFGRLCYSVLYILIRNAIMQTRGVLFRLTKNPNSYMKFNTGMKLNDYVNYYDTEDEGEMKIFSSFKFHEFLYGKQLSNNFKDRDNTPEFWKSHWEHDYSPFKVAQNVLKEFNIYLVDHTLYGNHLHSFMYYQLPEKTFDFWHGNNNIPNINSNDKTNKFNFKKMYNIAFCNNKESNDMIEYYELEAHKYNFHHLENESSFNIF